MLPCGCFGLLITRLIQNLKRAENNRIGVDVVISESGSKKVASDEAVYPIRVRVRVGLLAVRQHNLYRLLVD